MNLFCGFLSLIQVYEGDLINAAWLIVLSGFFDALDGMMARLTNGQSLFGVELDSLSDVVSFGVAPSFLIWAYGLGDYGTPGVIIASLPALAGAIRLARFNVQFEGTKSDFFSGLPIPVSALVIVAIILNDAWIGEWVDGAGDMRVIMAAVIVVSGLMVSSIPFDSIPQPNARYVRAHPVKTIIGLISLGVMVVFREPGLFGVLAVYLLSGMMRAFWNAVQTFRELDSPAEESSAQDRIPEG